MTACIFLFPISLPHLGKPLSTGAGSHLPVYPAQILVLSSRCPCWLSQNPGSNEILMRVSGARLQPHTLQPPICTFIYHLGMQAPSHCPGSFFGSHTASEQAMRPQAGGVGLEFTSCCALGQAAHLLRSQFPYLYWVEQDGLSVYRRCLRHLTGLHLTPASLLYFNA